MQDTKQRDTKKDTPEHQIPDISNPCWFPTLMHIGANDLMEKIPLPSVSAHTLRQSNDEPLTENNGPKAGVENDDRVWDPLYFNLMHQNQAQKDGVYRIMNFENRDPNFVEALYKMMTTTDCSHIKLNINHAAQTVKSLDASNDSYTQLMRAMIELDKDVERGGTSIFGNLQHENESRDLNHATDRVQSGPILRQIKTTLNQKAAQASEFFDRPSVDSSINLKNPESRPCAQPHHKDTSDIRTTKSTEKKKSKKIVAPTAITNILGTANQRNADSLRDLFAELFRWNDFKESDDIAISTQQLQTVHSEIQYAVNNSYLTNIDQESLVRLLDILTTEIRRSESLFFAQEPQNGMTEEEDAERDKVINPTDTISHRSSGQGKNKTTKHCQSDPEIISAMELQIDDNKHTLDIALDASIVALTVMTTPNMPKTVIVEETLESILNLIKQLQIKYIFPIAEREQQPEMTPTGRIRRARGKSRRSKKSKCLAEVDKLCNMLDHLSSLLVKIRLKDEFALSLSEISVSPFFVEGLSTVQLYSINTATLLFSHYHHLRHAILRDIIVSVVKLSNSKTISRNYRLDDGSGYIQTFTSLMLQLIQSCAGGQYHNTDETVEAFLESQTLALDPSSDDTPPNSSINNNITLDDFRRLYDESMSCAKVFSEYFLERCMQESVDGDNKNILENFVDDLLTVLNLPEWPSAEVVLQAIVRLLCDKLLDDRSQLDKNRNVALDIVGKVAAKCKEIGKEVTPYDLKTESDDENSDCSSNEDDDSSSDSDISTAKKKKKRQHGVQLFDGLWQELRLRYELGDGDAADDASHSEESDVEQKLKVLTFVYLSSRAGRVGGSSNDHIPIFARQFALCQWIMDETITHGQKGEQKDKKRLDANNGGLLLDLWNQSSTRFIGIKLGRTYVQKSYMRLLCMRSNSIVNRFDFMFRQILDVFTDDRATVRRRALKALQYVLAQDKSLLGTDQVKKVIFSRLMDQFPTVRDSVLDLVGNCVRSHAALVPVFVPAVIERIKDIAPSVRKKAIRVLGDICASLELTSHLQTTICVSLSSRLHPQFEEDESVVDLALKTLRSIWFPEQSSISVENVGNALKEVALQIVDTIHLRQNSDDSNTIALKKHWLTKVLRHAEYKSTNIIAIMMEQLVDHVVNQLLARERKDMREKHQKHEGRNNIVACMLTIQLFSMVRPETLLRHVTTLTNMLQLSNPAEFLVHVIATLDVAIPLMRFDDEFKNQFFKSLANITIKHEHPTRTSIESGVRCICRFVAHTGLWDMFFMLVNAIYASLKKAFHYRSLTVLALMCRYTDFHSIPANFSPPPGAKITPKNMLYTMYSECVRLSDDIENDNTQHAVITALAPLLVAHPQFFVYKSTITILEAVFSGTFGNNSREKGAILELFVYFLQAQEQRLEEASRDTTVNHDTGINGNVIPQYINRILELTRDRDDALRHEALKVVELVLRQGLCIPELVIASVVALVADPIRQIGDLAHQLVLFLEKRHYNFLVSKAANGIIQSYHNMQILSDCTYAVKGIFEVKSGGCVSRFDRLYAVFGGSHRKERSRIVDTVLTEMFATRDVQYVRYFSEAIAYLPFTMVDDLCQVIIAAIRHIDQHSDTIVASLETVVAEDEEDRSLLLDKNSLLDQLVDAMCLCHIIQMKKFLQESYGITDKKLEEMDSVSGTKLSDRHLQLNGSRYASKAHFRWEHLTRRIEQVAQLDHRDDDHVKRVVEHVRAILETLKDMTTEHMTSILTVGQVMGQTKTGQSRRGRPRKSAATSVTQNVTTTEDDSGGSMDQSNKSTPRTRSTGGSTRGRGRGRGRGTKSVGVRGRKRTAPSDSGDDEEPWKADDSSDSDAPGNVESAETVATPMRTRRRPIGTRNSAAKKRRRAVE